MSRSAPWPITLHNDLAVSTRSKVAVFLGRVHRLINWRPIEKALSAIATNTATRPRYPSLIMFKIILLQQWYGLSDPGAENAVNDRKSFADFVGLPEGASSPSYSTISRFRAELVRRGLAEPLIRMVSDQLNAKAFAIREGSMVEASLTLISESPQ